MTGCMKAARKNFREPSITRRHILSNMDNAMHKNQDGFLKDAPDYNGSPTTKNQDFMKSTSVQGRENERYLLDEPT